MFFAHEEFEVVPTAIEPSYAATDHIAVQTRSSFSSSYRDSEPLVEVVFSPSSHQGLQEPIIAQGGTQADRTEAESAATESNHALGDGNLMISKRLLPCREPTNSPSSLLLVLPTLQTYRLTASIPIAGRRRKRQTMLWQCCPEE